MLYRCIIKVAQQKSTAQNFVTQQKSIVWMQRVNHIYVINDTIYQQLAVYCNLTINVCILVL